MGLKHKYNKSVGFAEDFNLEGKKSKSLKLLKGWLKENPQELKEKWINAAKGTNESQTRDYKLTLVKRDDLVESQLGEGFINFDSLNTAEEIQKAKTYKDLGYKNDLNPITVDKGGFILNGNHRTAAAIENGDEYMLAFVEVGAGTGKITNLDEAIEALAGKAKKTTSKQVEKIDPPPATTIEPKTEAPQWNKLTKIGNQKGSNPGGMYQDTTTGKKYYIKEPGNDDIARNEVLAAKLYEAAGVEVPNVHLMNDGGTVRIASEIMEDLQQDATKLGSGKIQGVNDNFMVDAWLANWDVAGLGYDNLLIQGKKAIRIDVGGALRYRAQGGQKGAAFGKEVLEIESLRDIGMNPQSASVFAKASKEDMIAGARKVLALDKEQITELIDTFGPTTKKERTKLINTLVARQKHIAKQFPEAVKAPEPELPTSAPITRLEHEQVKNSRSNGYTIPTDKGDIEDQNVLLYHKKNLDGEDVTAAYFKIRPEMMRKLEKGIENLKENIDPYGDIHDKVISAVKSVAYRAQNKKPMEAAIFSKIENLMDRYGEVEKAMGKEIKDGLRPKKDLDNFKKRLKPFIDQLDEVLFGAGKGEVPTWNTKVGIYKPFDIPPPKSAKQKGPLSWKKKKTAYRLSKFERGHQREHSKIKELDTYHYETEVDGAIVRYWAKDNETYFALHGRTEIEIPGTRQTDTAKVFDTIGKLGISSQRATPLDIEELYLDKLAYIHRLDKKLANETRGITSQQQRIDQKLKLLNRELKTDLKQSPAYNPTGEYQAYGQGRRVHFRPELIVDPDFKNYFFTRIRTKNYAYGESGFVWKSKQAARMDAISYRHDAYGRTKNNYVQSNRHADLKSLNDMAKYDSNETIFKDSLSLFDDLDRIVASDSNQRDAIIKVFKKAGYDQWPDGRKLEDVIKVTGDP